jgi:ABC-type multidrug transport system permease subunit
MFSKMNKIIKFSLLGIIGFGISGAILGYIHGTENSWLWLLGFAAIGIIGGVTLGFIIGGRKAAQNLAMFGAIAGVLGGFFVSNSEYEPWIQMSIIGVVIGIVFAIAFSMLETGNRSTGKELFCSECDSKIGKNDNYCPNCGLRFE